MDRGLYGQSEGNERRSYTQDMSDIVQDNDLVEGDHVAVLKRMYKEKNWPTFTAYLQKLQKEGHSKSRVESMMIRAQARVKL